MTSDPLVIRAIEESLMPPPSDSSVGTPKSLIGKGLSCFRLPAPEGAVGLMMVGELDLVTADLARAAVRSAQAESPSVICDLGDVWFVDLSGLRVLLDAAAHATLTGGRLTVMNSPPIVPRMLAVLKLEDTLEIRATPRSAAAPDRRCNPARRHLISPT